MRIGRGSKKKKQHAKRGSKICGRNIVNHKSRLLNREQGHGHGKKELETWTVNTERKMNKIHEKVGHKQGKGGSDEGQEEQKQKGKNEDRRESKQGTDIGRKGVWAAKSKQ